MKLKLLSFLPLVVMFFLLPVKKTQTKLPALLPVIISLLNWLPIPSALSHIQKQEHSISQLPIQSTHLRITKGVLKLTAII